MTQPDRLIPNDAVNKGSMAAYAAKTQQDWEEERRAAVTQRLTPARAGFQKIGQDFSTIIDNLVKGFFGWTGSGFRHEDSAQALADQAAATAALSAAVTALQNNQNNQAVGGTAEFIDFSPRSDSSSLGGDFTQTYSGSGSGLWGIVSGRAAWISVNDAPRSCVAVYNAEQTTTDYQMVGASFATSPMWFNAAAQARNYLFGRMNSSGTSYVYADFGKYDVELGCVVSGVKTVFAAETDFSFKSNALYWLRTGTVGGLRIFQVLEGTTPIITHTEVGSTSMVGASYRYCGTGVKAYATGFGTSPPGKTSAWAFSDNQPANVVGSGARMVRAATSNVTASSGSNQLPSGFFDTPAESTADITADLTAGTFEVSVDSWYDVEVRLAINHFNTSNNSHGAEVAPFPLHLLLYKNGSVEKWIGDSVVPYPRGADSSGSGSQYYGSPDGAAAMCRIYLQAGDVISVGYNADAARLSFWTGDAGGLKTYFSIVRTGTRAPTG